jgi:hypothetical protein
VAFFYLEGFNHMAESQKEYTHFAFMHRMAAVHPRSWTWEQLSDHIGKKHKAEYLAALKGGVKAPKPAIKQLSAAQQLEELARKRAKAEGISIYQAYEAALKTPEGSRLYDAFLREKKGRRK